MDKPLKLLIIVVSVVVILNLTFGTLITKEKRCYIETVGGNCLEYRNYTDKYLTIFNIPIKKIN